MYNRNVHLSVKWYVFNYEVFTLVKICGKSVSTDSMSSRPNVRVISVMPCSHVGCSAFTRWHTSCNTTQVTYVLQHNTGDIRPATQHGWHTSCNTTQVTYVLQHNTGDIRPATHFSSGSSPPVLGWGRGGGFRIRGREVVLQMYFCFASFFFHEKSYNFEEIVGFRVGRGSWPRNLTLWVRQCSGPSVLNGWQETCVFFFFFVLFLTCRRSVSVSP